MTDPAAAPSGPGKPPPLCWQCHDQLRQLIDDWQLLCDTLRLDDETAVAGVIVATVDAMRRCDDEGHREDERT